jgi:hypothetical protein
MLRPISDPFVPHVRIAWLAASESTGPGSRVQNDSSATPSRVLSGRPAVRTSAPGKTMPYPGSPSSGFPTPAGGSSWWAITSGSSAVSSTMARVSSSPPW